MPDPDHMSDNEIEPSEPDPTAGWSEKRKAYEALRAEQNARGAELTRYREPQRPIVAGRHRFLKRARR